MNLYKITEAAFRINKKLPADMQKEAQLNLEKIVEEAFIDELQKIAKDSSYVKDFVYGVDPTGVRTFKAGLNNKKNHGWHRAVGTVGGTIGGAAITTAASGLGAMGLGKAIGVKNKALGEMIYKGGKSALKLFNPKRTLKTFKALPGSSKIMSKKMKLMAKTEEALANSSYKDKAIAAHFSGKTNPIVKSRNEIQGLEKAFVAKHKVNPMDSYNEGLGMAAGVAGATLGGGISGYTAFSQYGAGRNVKKMLNNKK